MLKIEDKTAKHFGPLVEEALKTLFCVIPEQEIKGIDKILLLDECPDKDFRWAGGFYRAAYKEFPAYIELYPIKIINAKPFFLPKTKFSKKYSITKMFLHELGHHIYGIKNLKEREKQADGYMVFYLKKLYGNWIYFFDLMGKIDYFLRERHYNKWKNGCHEKKYNT